MLIPSNPRPNRQRASEPVLPLGSSPEQPDHFQQIIPSIEESDVEPNASFPPNKSVAKEGSNSTGHSSALRKLNSGRKGQGRRVRYTAYKRESRSIWLTDNNSRKVRSGSQSSEWSDVQDVDDQQKLEAKKQSQKRRTDEQSQARLNAARNGEDDLERAVTVGQSRNATPEPRTGSALASVGTQTNDHDASSETTRSSHARQLTPQCLLLVLVLVSGLIIAYFAGFARGNSCRCRLPRRRIPC